MKSTELSVHSQEMLQSLISLTNSKHVLVKIILLHVAAAL